MEIYDVVKDLPLFEGIDAEQLDTVLDCMGAVEKTYKRNDYIMMEGGPVEAVGVVLSGSVSVEKEDVMGNTFLIAHIDAPGIFAETFACAGIVESPVSVRAAKDCAVLFMAFTRLMETCPSSCSFHNDLIQNMMRTLAQKNIYLNEKLNILSLRSLREKVVTYLLDAAKRAGGVEFSIPFSRSELADYLGADRSALSRVLGQLRDEGLITFQKSSFKLRGAQA